MSSPMQCAIGVMGPRGEEPWTLLLTRGEEGQVSLTISLPDESLTLPLPRETALLLAKTLNEYAEGKLPPS